MTNDLGNSRCSRNTEVEMSVNSVPFRKLKERETQSSDRKEEGTLVKRKLTERFWVVELNMQSKIIIYLLHGIFSTFDIIH